jgi:hypothetical protein
VHHARDANQMVCVRNRRNPRQQYDVIASVLTFQSNVPYRLPYPGIEPEYRRSELHNRLNERIKPPHMR